MARPIVPLRPFALQTPPERHEVVPRRLAVLSVAALAALACIYGLTFGWLSLQSYWAYRMHALDMGNMGQAAWNTVHGHLFFFTNMRLAYNIEAWKTTTRLSFHVEPIFPLISLVYLIHAGPESLLVLQTIALTVGVIPVFLLARDQLHSLGLALVFSLAYVLFPALQSLNLYEFHPVALATPLLLFAFYFATRRQWALFVICCLGAMATKEEIGLVVALFGLYAAFVMHNRRLGFSLAAFGVAWSLFAALVVEHHFRQPGTVTYLHSRYHYLGHGVSGAVNTVFLHPGTVAGVVFTLPKLRYVIHLLAPTGFLALLSPLTLALGLPTLLLNVLSQEPHMYSGLGDNSAELISVVMISSILGAKYLLRALVFWIARPRAVLLLAAYVIGAAVWTQHSIGFLPSSLNFSAPVMGAHQRLADQFVHMVPAGVPVSTQDQLDPHLSSRHYLYLFEDLGTQPPPPQLPEARYVLLDASAPTYPLPSYQLHDRAKSLLQRPDWGIVAARDGLILMKYGANSKRIPPAFYSYLSANGSQPDNALQGASHGVGVLGYNLTRTDAANQYPANMQYTFFLQPRGRLHEDIQPIVFAVMNGTVVNCQSQPLGLAWLPTSRWNPGSTYVVSMQPMQIDTQKFGTAQLYASLGSSPVDPGKPANSCSALWSRHGHLWNIGHVVVGF